MKKRIMPALIVMLAMLLSICAAAQGQYNDVAEDFWAFREIAEATEKGWFNGYPDGRFVPMGSITRAEAIKAIAMFSGRRIVQVSETSFRDVPAQMWCAPYVQAGRDLFPEREDNTLFCPDELVTREDTICALVRALGRQGELEDAALSVLDAFSDRSSLTKELEPYVALAVSWGTVTGSPDGTIRGGDALTRAEFAALLTRAAKMRSNDAQNAASCVLLRTYRTMDRNGTTALMYHLLFADGHDERVAAADGRTVRENGVYEYVLQDGKYALTPAAISDHAITAKDAGRTYLSEEIGRLQDPKAGVLLGGKTQVHFASDCRFLYVSGEDFTVSDTLWQFSSAVVKYAAVIDGNGQISTLYLLGVSGKNMTQHSEEPIFVHAADVGSANKTDAEGKKVALYVYDAVIGGECVEIMAREAVETGFYVNWYDVNNGWYILDEKYDGTNKEIRATEEILLTGEMLDRPYIEIDGLDVGVTAETKFASAADEVGADTLADLKEIAEDSDMKAYLLYNAELGTILRIYVTEVC